VRCRSCGRSLRTLGVQARLSAVLHVPGRRADESQRLSSGTFGFPRSYSARLSPASPRIAFNPRLLRCLVLDPHASRAEDAGIITRPQAGRIERRAFADAVGFFAVICWIQASSFHASGLERRLYVYRLKRNTPSFRTRGARSGIQGERWSDCPGFRVRRDATPRNEGVSCAMSHLSRAAKVCVSGSPTARSRRRLPRAR
jgi:hypothetical protein